MAAFSFIKLLSTRNASHPFAYVCNTFLIIFGNIRVTNAKHSVAVVMINVGFVQARINNRLHTVSVNIIFIILISLPLFHFFRNLIFSPNPNRS